MRGLLRTAAAVMTLLLTFGISLSISKPEEQQQATSLPQDNRQNSPEAINKPSNQQIELPAEVEQEARVRRRSKSANLLPTFPTPIGNVTAVLGRDVRLVCTVDNLGSYQVAWLKEESKTIISIDTNIIITNYRIFLIPDEEERKWVLHIKDVQESDRGFYQCQVNTSPMRATSGYLEVVVPPSIINSQSSQVVETTEHSNVNLQCKAAGQPRPTIVWRRDDGAPIKLSGRATPTGSEPPANNNSDTSGELGPLSQLNEVKSDKLLLFDVDRSMAGIYVCSASNGIPTEASKRIPLYVKFEPKATVQTKLVSVALGEPLELDCLIEGFPKPVSSWSKSNQLKRNLAKVQQTNGWYPTAQTIMVSNETGSGPSSLHSSQQRGRSLEAAVKLPPNDFFLAAGNSNFFEAQQQATTFGLDKAQNYPPSQSYHQSNPSQLSVFSATSHPHNNRIKFKRQLEDDHHHQLTSTSEVALPAERPLGVSMKQTALNPYTYKLQLSIARMRPDDFGKYSCTASNQMGASEAQVLVIKSEANNNNNITREKGLRSSSSQQSSFGSSDYRSIEEQEYQRDSLNGQLPAEGAFRQQASNGNKVVYDENYLQAIKSRQNGLAGVAGSRLQQRLKSKSKSKSGPKLKANWWLVWVASLIHLALQFWLNL